MAKTKKKTVKKATKKVEKSTVDLFTGGFDELTHSDYKLLKKIGLRLLEDEDRRENLRDLIKGSTGGDEEMDAEVVLMSVEDLYDHYAESYQECFLEFLRETGITDE